VAKVLHETFAFTSGTMTTIHSYTNDQKSCLDLPAQGFLRRAPGRRDQHDFPARPGAAKALHWCCLELKGKLDGYAMRVQTQT